MAWVTQFMDGFDHYATADIAAKWSFMGTGSVQIDSTTFRNSGQALRISGSGGMVSKLTGQARNWCVGFAYYCPAGVPATLTADGATLMGFGNNLEAPIGGQVGVGHLSDGKLHVARSEVYSTVLNAPTELGVTTTVLNPSTWYYIEMRVFIDDTAGQIEVRVNGTTELNLTGIDTKHQASIDYASVFMFGGGGSTGAVRRYDDFYMRTSSSSTAESGGFLGDVKVKPYYPNADGTYTAMTCSTGTTHYTLVDESVPNTTDYVSSSTALTKDSYNFQDASETGSIKAVQVSAYAYKMDAGFRGAEVFIKSGATEVFGTSQPLSTTAKYVQKLWDQDPNTSADWSQTNLNAAEFGVRISADL